MTGDVMYSVVSEFGFDVADAVTSSGVLQSAIGKVDEAVDHLKGSLIDLAGHAALAFGLGGGGLLAVLGKSLSLSEKLQNSQMRFFGLFTANADKMGDSVKDLGARMALSKEFASDLADAALRIGQSSSAMLDVGNALAGPMLAMHANPGRIASMAEKVMVTAPVLGQDPHSMTEQLVRMINGGAGIHNQLFSALANSGPAMEKYQGQHGSMRFNMLSQVKRFELLEKAVSQFADKPEIAAAGMNTLSAQFTRFRSLLWDVQGVLQPIGDFLSDKLIKLLRPASDWIVAHKDQIKSGIGEIIGHLDGITPKLIEFAFAMRHTRSSFDLARGAVHFASLMLMITSVVRFLTGRGLFSLLAEGLGKLVPYLFTGRIFTVLATALNYTGKAVSFLMPMIRTMAGLFGLFSVVFFYAQAAYAGTTKYFVENINGSATKLMALGKRFGEALAIIGRAFYKLSLPFIDAFDGLAMALGDPALALRAGDGLVTLLIKLAHGFETLCDWAVKLYSVLIGFCTAIVGFLANIGKLPGAVMETATGGSGYSLQNVREDFFKLMGESAVMKYQDLLGRNPDGSKKDKTTAQGNTNLYGGITVNMQFKENQEPDRIAFTLKEQIIKTMRNKTQARGGTLAVQGAR